MSYRYEEKWSPNFTRGSSTQAIYGRPRTVSMGAGHWWGDPNAGYGHDGVINTFMNPARQASAHLVISKGRVTKMVKFTDTSWATSHANPYTISIELDPRVYLRTTTAQKAMSDGIKATLLEYMANVLIPKYGNLEWKAHKDFNLPTACNPLPWATYRNQALALYKKNLQPEWEKNLVDIKDTKLIVLPGGGTPIIHLETFKTLNTIPKGTWVDIAKQTTVKGKKYYLSSYSAARGLPNGLLAANLGMPVVAPPQDKPSWLDHWEDIEDQPMYLRSDAHLVNLEDGSNIKLLKQGTEVLISSTTEHLGKAWGISGYSTDNKLPHGIQLLHLDTRPQDDTDLEPDPIQPPIEPIPPGDLPIIRFLNWLLDLITDILNKIKE